MDFGPNLIDYLVEFYSAQQIRTFWKEAGDALMSRSTCLIHIKDTSFKGQTSTGIALATPQEQQAFMAACKQALNRLEGVTSIDAAQLATGVDFSRRPVLV